LISLLEEKIF
jgi:hypothetical protein